MINRHVAMSAKSLERRNKRYIIAQFMFVQEELEEAREELKDTRKALNLWWSAMKATEQELCP